MLDESKKYLVVYADDFGVNHAHNKGVLKSFTNGILTSAGMIACTPWFTEAVEIAKEYNIPLGAHLSHTCEYSKYRFGPLTRDIKISDDGLGYIFKKSANDIPKEYEDSVIKEAEAQIERIQKSGLNIYCLESHMAVIPRWDDAFARSVEVLVSRYKIPFRRLPDKDLYKKEWSMQKFLNIEFFGISEKLEFKEKKKKFLKKIENLKNGISWCVGHIADNIPTDIDEAGAAKEWGVAVRYTDMQVLCDKDVKEAIKDLKINLISVKDVFNFMKEKMG